MALRMTLLILSMAWAGWAVDLGTLIPNTWVEALPAYEGAPNGGVYPSGGLAPQCWNNKGVYDPASRRVMVYDRWLDTLHGGSIYANALLAYDPVANVVTVLKINNYKALSENVVIGGITYGTIPTAAFATDSTPVDRHPLGNLALATGFGKVYLGYGYNQGASYGGVYGNGVTDAWGFDLSANRWSFVSNEADVPWGGCTVMEYDTLNKKVVLLSNTGSGPKTYLLDPATNQWTSLPVNASAAGISAYGAGVAYDSRRHLVVLLGSGLDTTDQYVSGRLAAYSVADNRWTRLADCPAEAPQPGFAYDSKNDVFLALIDNDTYIYNPRTDSWAKMAKTLERQSVGRYHCAQPVTYDAANDVFVFAGGHIGYAPPQWCVFRYDSLAALTETALDPADGSLMRAFPNPCQGSALFTGLPRNGVLKIYSASGRLFRELELSGHGARWDLKDWKGVDAAPGIYLYRAIAGASKSRTGLLTIIK